MKQVVLSGGIHGLPVSETNQLINQRIDLLTGFLENPQPTGLKTFPGTRGVRESSVKSAKGFGFRSHNSVNLWTA